MSKIDKPAIGNKKTPSTINKIVMDRNQALHHSIFKFQTNAKTHLTYNIVSMTLSGTIDGEKFNHSAYSGGRAGTKTKGAANLILANNPFLVGHKHNEKDPNDSGGALPMGYYTLSNHESRTSWIRLKPFKGNQMQNRDGFAIHKRGPRGSDGCIVPKDSSVVDKLYKLVKEHSENGWEHITLQVIAVGELDRFYPFTQIS